MSKNFRDRLDSWARRAHVNYFGEHLSYDERGALDNVDTPLDASNPPVTKDDLATSTVTSFNGRVGAVTPEAADYNASDIDNDSSVSGSKVNDALDELQTEVETNATDIATLSAATYPDTMVQALGVEMNYRSNVLDDSGTYYANEGANEISTLMTNALYKKVNLLLTPSGTKAGTGAGDGTLYSIKGDNFTVARNSIKGYINVDGYIKFVAVDEATIDYSDGAAAIVLEPESRNKYLYPFAAENSYSSKTGLSVELDPGTAGADLENGWNFTTWSTHGTNVTVDDANSFTTLDDYTGIKHNVPGATTGNSVQIHIAGTSTGFVYIQWGGGAGVDLSSAVGSGFDKTIYLQSNASVELRILTSDHGTTDISTLEIKEVQGFASPFKDAGGNILKIARKLVEDTSTGVHRIYKSGLSITANGNVSITAIIKKGERSKFKLEPYFYGGTAAIFKSFVCDLETGTKVSGDELSYSIKEYADGYYGVSATFDYSDNTSCELKVYLLNDSGLYSYAGDGTSGLYIAGVQFEKQPAATSFINDPEDAEGSEVTRVDETDTITVPSGTLKIVETFSDGTTNEITTIPATYTIPAGKPIDNVIFYTEL